MCIEVRKTCECGAHRVQFHLRDNLMQPEVIERLFCPSCSRDAVFDGKSMLNDNGWVIAYDMTLARMLAAGRIACASEAMSPAFLFDHGYACWLELYPGEREEIREEKERIMALREEDQKRYLEVIQCWNIERVARLKEAGWRKALAA